MAVVLLAVGKCGRGTCPAPAILLLSCLPPPAGHPGNMAVVLLAMGMYGCGYLGWRIRLSDDAGEVATAQDLHPKVGQLGRCVRQYCLLTWQ